MNKLVIGNLKMNLLSPDERDKYLDWLKKDLVKRKLGNSDIVLCPPFIHLEAFQKWNRNKIVKLGSQDVFFEEKGSFTGEISPIMLKNFGAEYVIIGHSERRKYFGETDEVVNIKTLAALKSGLKPVVCVGETKAQKDSGQALKVITEQISKSLANVNRTKSDQITIAYEPVWAVGTDLVPSSNEVMEAKLLIKKILIRSFEAKYANNVRIVYGGSVSSRTAEQVCIDADMDGALVGRESLIPNEFLKIAEIINN